MKTFNKITESEENRLVIEHEISPESPREWSNLGYFITKDSNYLSPDEHNDFENIIDSTGQDAKDQDEHMDLIKKAINEETDEKVLAIYPVVKYEHSNISYSLGTKHGFDYSNNGFYIITKESQKETGTNKKDFQKVIEQEIEVYNNYVNGDVYFFTLFDDNGEIEDSCGGFYDIEDMREHLPKEWKDEDLNDYLSV